MKGQGKANKDKGEIIGERERERREGKGEKLEILEGEK